MLTTSLTSVCCQQDVTRQCVRCHMSRCVQADKDDSDDESREDFVFPYNLGWKTNFSQVFHWSRRPQLNGIWWPVKDGCDQFTLTVSTCLNLDLVWGNVSAVVQR